MAERLTRKFARVSAKYYQWIKHHIPPGVRTVIGLLLVVAGVFGFMPIAGFWMIPLGIAVILIDLRALYLFVRQRWQDRKK